MDPKLFRQTSCYTGLQQLPQRCHSATPAMPAGTATRRSTLRKSKTLLPANASPRQSYASNLAGGPISENHCHREPNGSAKDATNVYGMKPKCSKLKPSKHAFAKKSTFAPSPITSELCAVIEFPRIEPPLGLDQGNQQHLISATLGGPGQARDLVGGP